ncbi:hypothetical protein EG68_05207 [Paragonimus skrjabini miyazakii]|uniref:Uncharacterized protein n=1 Tax=Paragonimus skrjabini miyazakii TaxID=59628 RepID=A0A8S9YSG9_9TREM|nr:hypothetical protein EG68_05207 [Paragonimus skrjabini miyazakii]
MCMLFLTVCFTMRLLEIVLDAKVQNNTAIAETTGPADSHGSDSCSWTPADILSMYGFFGILNDTDGYISSVSFKDQHSIKNKELNNGSFKENTRSNSTNNDQIARIFQENKSAIEVETAIKKLLGRPDAATREQVEILLQNSQLPADVKNNLRRLLPNAAPQQCGFIILLSALTLFNFVNV